MRTLRLAALIALIVVAPAAGGLIGTTLKLGQTYTITGRTGSYATSRPELGPVVLTGRWAGGRWHVLARTTTRGDGTYRLSIKPARRGTLELRLATPDHQVARVSLRVT